MHQLHKTEEYERARFTRSQKMIKIASNPELNTTMSSHLGMEALYEIATLPEPERTKEHVTSSGETKT